MPESANETISAEDFRDSHTSEEAIHKAVVEWADRQAATEPALEMLFHVPNGGSRHPAEAKKLKEMGTRQGVPDLLLPVRREGADGALAEKPKGFIQYSGLALELKSPSGRVRPEQAWWLSKLKNEGWAVAVAFTFFEARTLLTEYLSGEHEQQETLDLTIAEPPRHVGE